MARNGELNLCGGNVESRGLVRQREDEEDSRLRSENLDVVGQPARKKYHKNTPQQIQELEAFFNNCAYPDERQRTELGTRLGMDEQQIKFWFQNRKTQMKIATERQENVLLRQNIEKLKAEQEKMMEAMRNPVCYCCGGPAMLGDWVYEEHQARIENARLKDELNRMYAKAQKVLGKRIVPSEIANLAVPNAGITMPIGLSLGDGILPVTTPPVRPLTHEIRKRSALTELALKAMSELMRMARPDTVLWETDMEGRDKLNLAEYAKNFRPCIGIRPYGFVTEVSRDSGMVIIDTLDLVTSMMNVARWVKFFPCLVAKANTISVISDGIEGTKNGSLLQLEAEFQVLSSLVPVRRVKFLRYCKQHAEGVWAVVDVSVDSDEEGSSTNASVNCRRLPSGFVAKKISNGYSKVTWVEHSEYDENDVHHLYRPMINSGKGFGAQRWIATLQRQSEWWSLLMSPSMPIADSLSPAGRKSMLKLAQRMTENFCAGVSPSSVLEWEKIQMAKDIQMLTRMSVGDLGEPSGVLLSATMSMWMPVTRHQLFDFLRNEQLRNKWDILSSNGTVQKMTRISKGQHENFVSLLRVNSANAANDGMFILQETWTDDSASLLVYAPVDLPSMNVVANGGDHKKAPLLSSGFAIFPDGLSTYGQQNGTMNHQSTRGNGCLLTVCFQILLNSKPTAEVSMESLGKVNNLLTRTIQKIKVAVHAE